ncbi:hypothetical protein MVEN_00582600 [Mycena venus]|uniref:Uncharacterized protein n=1 Tax=Mycena venus TaxID=2733690 RepID=A0A8H6YPW1_9AGAR|nr:hypothetical protein MVEN_00582600 [Mycena venus]
MSRSTAATPYSLDDDRPARYTFSTEQDDDDDESSAEDVFAFLPPSTADAPQHDTEKSNIVRPDSFAGTGSEEGSIKMEFDFDAIEEEDSPFPEVRASVSNIDDPDMPALTIRMWFVGLFLCTISSSLNVFFNFRSPASLRRPPRPPPYRLPLWQIPRLRPPHHHLPLPLL